MSESTFEGVFEALTQGDLEQARRMIVDLQDRLDPSDPPELRSRAARVAATVARLAGAPEQALALVEAALEQAASDENTDPNLAIEAEIECAATLSALGRHEDAEAALVRAELLAEATGARAEVLAKIDIQRVTIVLGRDPVEALVSLQELAAELPSDAAATLAALTPAHRSLLEALELLVSGAPSDDVLQSLNKAADAARYDEDLDAYVGARLASAQVAEESGDRVGAYRSLAEGWATTRAAFGLPLARAIFTPAMEDCEARWGAVEFERVQAAVADS